MEDKRISELEQVTKVTGEELIPIVIDGENKTIKSKYLNNNNNNNNNNGSNNLIINQSSTLIKVSELKDQFANDWELLKHAMDNFEEIYIDEDLNVEVTESYNINHSLHIKGSHTINFTSELTNLLFINEENLDIVLEGIGLVLDFNGRLISGNNDGSLTKNVNLVEVNNCDITGRGILILLYTPIATEGDVNVINVCKFDNNYIHDLKMEFQSLPLRTDNYQCYGLFIVENVGCHHLSLNHNVIRNTERTIGQFKKRIARSPRSLMEIKSNNYINDDTCWGRNDEQDAMYYTFIMAEGDTCIYEDNYIEGLKIKTWHVTGGGRTVGAETYDSYTMCKEYIARNNVIKNCMPFYSNSIVNSADSALVPTIYKTKGSYNAHIENNTFIIEQSFIDTHNPVGDELNQTFVIYECTPMSVNEKEGERKYLTIRNNIIDVPKVKFEKDRTDFTKTYEFSHNEIKCDTIEGYVFYDTSENTGDRIFSHNRIVATSDPDTTFKIVHHPGNPIAVNSNLYIENNYIYAINFYKAISGGNDNDRYSRYIQYGRVIMKNNIFYRRPYFNNCRGNFIFENNKIITLERADSTYYSSQVLTAMHIKETLYYPDLNKILMYIGNPLSTWNNRISIFIKAYQSDGTTTEMFKTIKFEGENLIIDGETVALSGLDTSYRTDDVVIRLRMTSTPLLAIGVNAVDTSSGKTYSRVDFEVYGKEIV